jgi:hypothetical protein
MVPRLLRSRGKIFNTESILIFGLENISIEKSPSQPKVIKSGKTVYSSKPRKRVKRNIIVYEYLRYQSQWKNQQSFCHSVGNLTKCFDEVNLKCCVFSMLRFLRNDKQLLKTQLLPKTHNQIIVKGNNTLNQKPLASSADRLVDFGNRKLHSRIVIICLKKINAIKSCNIYFIIELISHIKNITTKYIVLLIRSPFLILYRMRPPPAFSCCAIRFF